MISIQVKYSIDDNVLIYNLNNEYGIHAESIHFIPMGDSAYSYRVDCFDEHKYYLKLFDHQNDGHQKSVGRLRFYLPLTWQMYHRGLFTNITYPLANKNGGFQTMFSDITIVLFNFIDGESLAQAYPFSPKILCAIAESMAKIEGVTPLIDPDIVLTETFDIDFGFDLKRCISVLEGLTPRDSVKRKLQDFILPEKDRILAFQKIVKELRLKAIADTRPKVLCHGDIWGGNLIRNANRLYFIDWESAVLAPFELNLLNFIGDDFEIFYTQYMVTIHSPEKR